MTETESRMDEDWRIDQAKKEWLLNYMKPNKNKINLINKQLIRQARLINSFLELNARAKTAFNEWIKLILANCGFINNIIITVC